MKKISELTNFFYNELHPDLKKLEDDRKNPALKKYAAVGRLFADDPQLSMMTACEVLVENIFELTGQLKLPSLRQFGIKKSHFDNIADNTGNKYNPVTLETDDLVKILHAVY